ncbi:transcriptional regulator [Longispora fulva]|nr:transcriptional regulator [Longispora fulva]
MRHTVWMAGPTLRRRRLARALRARRDQVGLGLGEAAKKAGVSKSTLSRLEDPTVTVMPSVPTVATLARIYGASEQDIEALTQVAREARQRGWWRKFSDVLPDWFELYVGLEFDASEIRDYSVAQIPGLLQTEDYAGAVLSTGPRTAAAIEKLIELRMRRQARDDKPRLHFIIDDVVLRRPVGNPGVMRGQLARLLNAAEQPNLTLQILPASAGAHGSMGMAWTELLFDTEEDPPLIYLENYTSSLYLEERPEVEQYEALFGQLRKLAMTPKDSTEAIAAAADGT